MPTVREITGHFSRVVPNEMKLETDNVGLLVGIRNTEVKRALVALDITDEVIDEAIEADAQIIISHHPLFFDLKQIDDDSLTGAKIVKLLQNGISALCLHTNLDQVNGGVNNALAERLGISVAGILGEEKTASNGERYGMGRFGTLSKPLMMSDYLSIVKEALGANGLRYHDPKKNAVYTVAVCGGTGGSFVEAAVARGCDTLVTADIKHSEFLKAKALKLNVIDGGHFDTENVVVPVLADMLKKAFPEVSVMISEVSKSAIAFHT